MSGTITVEEAREKLPEWLTFAALHSEWSEWDNLCNKAYDVLGDKEYGEIWNRWYKEQV